MSRWLAVIFVLAHVLPGSTHAALVGHWSFDAGSGTTVTDASTEANHGVFAVGASTPTWISGALAAPRAG